MFTQPDFFISETPILSLVRSVHAVEQRRQGIESNKVFRDPVILPGMPGSSCQMHIHLVNEAMKGMKRKQKIDKSESTVINKYKFKA